MSTSFDTNISRRRALQLVSAVPAVAALPALPLSAQSPQTAWTPRPPYDEKFVPRKFTFDGVFSEFRLTLANLGLVGPTDLSDYTHLVLEMRTSSPQRM